MSRRDIEGNYARLKGLQRTVMVMLDFYIAGHFADDYSRILIALRREVDDDFEGFDIPRSAFRDSDTHPLQKDALLSKLNQIVDYLEAVHNASNRIVEIGSAYNLIRDDVLRSRCSDLLSARDHFDRVLNQATQVLEERIRQKCSDLASDIGANLVGKAINSDPNKTRIKFSDTPSEQEGYAALFRGLVAAFRNPSHHRFIENVSREQSLQICAFVDNMLSALEIAEIVR